MRIAVIDSTGAVGQSVVKILSRNEDWTIHALSRQPNVSESLIQKKNVAHLFTEHVVFPPHIITNWYNYIINCYEVFALGRTYQEINNLMNININLPTYLAEHPLSYSVINWSTPAVFKQSTRPLALESNNPDEPSNYARSKVLGEVDHPKVINIRWAGTDADEFGKICENIIKKGIKVPNIMHAYSQTNYPDILKEMTE